MVKLIKVLETKTVDELIEVLESHRGKEVSIFGSGMPIYVHEEDNTIILDEHELIDN